MTTYIQISTIGYDNIEDQEELEILESLAGDDRMQGFVWIVDGDQSLIRQTSLNPIYGEEFTVQQLLDALTDGEHDDITTIIVDEDVDGISDYLDEMGWTRGKSYHTGEFVFCKQ